MMQYSCYTCRNLIDSLENYHMHNMHAHSIEDLSLSLIKIHQILLDSNGRENSLNPESTIECFKQNNNKVMANSNLQVTTNQNNHSINAIGKKLDAMVVHFGKSPFTEVCRETNQLKASSNNIKDVSQPAVLSSSAEVYTLDPINELAMIDIYNDKDSVPNSSQKYLEKNNKIVTSCPLDQDIQPVKVTMRSGRISKSNKCKSEFVYFDTVGSNCKKNFEDNKKHSLHSKCKAAISHKCLPTKVQPTVDHTDEEESSKDKLLNIFGSDFDFNGWLSANEIDISIEDLDLDGFDDFEGVLPENRTLTIENLIEDLEASSNEFSSIINLNSPQRCPVLDESLHNASMYLSPVKKLEAPIKVNQSMTLDSHSFTCEAGDKPPTRNTKFTKKAIKKCEICRKPFKTKKTLLSHLRKYHTDSNWMKFHCSTCGERFAYLKTFQRHIKNHNPASKFVCEQCGKIFMHLINLKTHQTVHDKTISYKCTHCDKIFYHKYSYNKHLKLHDPKSIYRCDACQKTFANKSKHLSHMNRHESGKYLGRSVDFRCNSCGDTKSSEELKLLNGNQNCQYVTCKNCQRGLYKRYLYLNNSAIVDKKLEKSKTTECSIFVKEVINLDRHTKESIRIKTVVCELCNKSLKSTSLKAHMHRKHEGTSVVCEHCNKIFKNVLSLQEHMSKIR